MKIYLDLLPQEKKNELKREKIFRKILREEFLFFLPIVVLIVILANVYYLARVHRDTLISMQLADKSQDKFQKLNLYQEKFAKTNDDVAKLSKIQLAHLQWGKLFVELNNVVPSGIMIDEIATKNYQVILTGRAKVRDDLLNFKSNLDNSKCFNNVNMPLSDLVTKEDVDFQMDFVISKDCLLGKI